MPDILALTETRLNDQSITNIDLCGFNFFHVDSLTMAGGTGIYVSKELHVIPRPDIKFDSVLIESCWIEIETDNNTKNTIIGCIYRHPKANLNAFTSELENILSLLNQSKHNVYILGDMNIDFFKYNSHIPTEEYLDMLYSQIFLPLITKPTRVTDHTATLIAHIYTNSALQSITSGIACLDISDHLPIFCIVESFSKNAIKQRFYRDYSKFNKGEFIDEIKKTNWNEILCSGGDLHDLGQQKP
jgi:hypothetical protein